MSIDDINRYIQDTLFDEGYEKVRAVEAAEWLSEAKLLVDSTDRPGQPLRRLLRGGSIIGASKEGGRWFIYPERIREENILKENDYENKLEELKEYYYDLVAKETLINLLDEDPLSFMGRIRSISEYIAKNIAKDNIGNYDDNSSFSDTINLLSNESLISDITKHYLDLVRKLGNTALHKVKEFKRNKKESAIMVCNSFLLFIEEAKDKNLL